MKIAPFDPGVEEQVVADALLRIAPPVPPLMGHWDRAASAVLAAVIPPIAPKIPADMLEAEEEAPEPDPEP